jgi:hypothetical protein
MDLVVVFALGVAAGYFGVPRLVALVKAKLARK